MADPAGPGDTLVRVGAVLFVVGVVGIVVTVAPFLLNTARLPTPAYVVCMMAPLGFGIALLGLVRSGRARRRRSALPQDAPPAR
jgi:FtsH-binding integral membrane protein